MISLGEVQAQLLQNLTKTEILDFFDRKIRKDAPERRLVAIYVHGNTESKESITEKQTKEEFEPNYVCYHGFFIY